MGGSFTDIKRCTSCILPETFPGIEFDKQGSCNYCKSYRRVGVYGEKALKQKLEQYRGRGSKYDCIIPTSGGRDSAFVLHQIVKKYNMRSLSLTVDNGAIMPEGFRNIDQVTKALNVDHVWIRDEKQIAVARKNTKTKFRAWLRSPSINTIVPVLNAADKTMNLRMYVFAQKNNIPLVIGGNNVGNSTFEQEHFKTGFLGVFPNERGSYSGHDKIRLTLLLGLEYLKNLHNYHWSVFKEYLLGMSAYFFESAIKPSNVEPLGFYDYIYWTEREVLSTIEKIGWKGAPDTTATWRIDDSAYPLIDYLYLQLLGFNEFDEFYSKLVREGQITRREALRRCLSENKPRIPSLMRTLEELDVTKAQVDRAIEQYRSKLLAKIERKT